MSSKSSCKYLYLSWAEMLCLKPVKKIQVTAKLEPGSVKNPVNSVYPEMFNFSLMYLVKKF